MKLSAFSFVHNALTGGVPIVEAIEAVRPYVDDIVVVDMESTDRTPLLLERLGARVLSSPWPWSDNPRDTLNHAFELHTECRHDQVVFFEADEVYDDRLLLLLREEINNRGSANLAVWRLQLEQNFQRCRWYPIPVHRVFPKGQGSYALHPTHCPDGVTVLPPSAGFLWDISNCFRDNWFGRKAGQAELWGEPRSLMAPEHFTQAVETSRGEEEMRLGEAHWQWTETPFRIPDLLRPLVGVTDYAHSSRVKALLEGEQ